MPLHPILLSGGSPIGGLLPLAHSLGFALVALLLVAFQLASRQAALLCFGAALALVLFLHRTALSLEYWYWKMLMTGWQEMPFVVLAPLMTAALVLSPMIRSRYRGDSGGVQVQRADLAALNGWFLAVAVFTGATLQVMAGQLTDYWDPDTGLRLSQSHPSLTTLLGILAFASTGVTYAWLARRKALRHRAIGGAVAGALVGVVFLARGIPAWRNVLTSHLVTLDEVVVRLVFAVVFASAYSCAGALLAAPLFSRVQIRPSA